MYRIILENVSNIKFPVNENINLIDGIVYYEEKVGFYENDVTEKQITLTDLAKKCKYYCLEKDFQLLSGLKKYKEKEEEKIKGLCDIFTRNKELECKYTHYEENEELAILKATEWVINKIK